MKQGKFEIHGFELFQGSGPWWRNGKAKKFRLQLLQDILKIPSEIEGLIKEDLPIVYGAVYKPELQNRYGDEAWDPEELAFVLCMEQVEHYFTKFCDKEKGLMLGDRNQKKEFAIRNLSNYMRSFQTPIGRNPMPLTHMIETVHFADSESTFGIQFADVCCFVIKRHLVDAAQSDIIPLYELIEPHFKRLRVWPKKPASI
jgi:hypothetical protein